jgi:Mce-associated membrane protein
MADVETEPERTDAADPPIVADPQKTDRSRASRWAVSVAGLARRPSRWTVMVAGLALLLVVLLVGGVLLLQHNRSVGEVAAQRQLAMEAAERVALGMSTISSENPREQLDILTRDSTGTFRDQITSSAAVFAQAVQMGRVSSRGVVTGAGLENIGPDTATALVGIRATITNSQAPQGVQRNHRIAVQLQREGDRWLASNVLFVP